MVLENDMPDFRKFVKIKSFSGKALATGLLGIDHSECMPLLLTVILNAYCIRDVVHRLCDMINFKLKPVACDANAITAKQRLVLVSPRLRFYLVATCQTPVSTGRLLFNPPHSERRQ